ncbi:MAG: hypothetical protein E7388_02465 [Ruminococcaceae bacterium]|nr:hypothetical protein [Oscillospiraceae bacterium]
MKKSLIVIMAVIMVVTCLFAGCEKKPEEPVVTPKVAGVPEEPAAPTTKVEVDEKKGKDYTTIEFGRYPSTELDAKKDADIIEALGKLAESEADAKTGYFTYKDTQYQKEIKIVKDEDGLDVTEVHWFEVEPISWIVLEEKDGKLFVIAEENVNAVPFNKTPEDTNWAISTLRDWLNGLNEYKNTFNFYNCAFTAEEQSVIVTQDITTAKNADYNTESGEAVKDRVSILSVEQIEDSKKWADGLFNEDKDELTLGRACGNTEYSLFKGAAAHISYDRKNSSWYWLRNSGANAKQATYVNEMGNTISAGYTVSFPQNGVRPTLVLDTANIILK